MSASNGNPIVRVVASGFEPAYCGFLQEHLPPDDGFALFLRSGSVDSVLLDCQRMSPCVWLAAQDLVEQVETSEFGNEIDYGRMVQVLVVGPGEDAELARRLLHLGCTGFLRQDALPATIRKAIRAVARGELWADRTLACRVFQESLQQSRCPRLTAREREILSLIAEGRTNRTIAETLHITRDTVRWHIRGLYGKIGVQDRLSAVFYARDYFGAEPGLADTVAGHGRKRRVQSLTQPNQAVVVANSA